MNGLLAGCFSLAALSLSPDSGKSNTVQATATQAPSIQEGSLLPGGEDPHPLAGAPDSSIPPQPPPLEAVSLGISAEEGQPVSSSPSEEYKIQREDILNISVYEEPELTTKVRVTGSGEINFPLLGRVLVADLSVIEVQEKLTQALAEDYLINPQVQVFIEAYHDRSVFVTGSVNKPGSYPLPAGKGTTLMEAIAMAGGFNEEASVNGTRIIRIEDGHEKTIHVKANDIIKKGDKNKDVEIRPNDVVFVPESFF